MKKFAFQAIILLLVIAIALVILSSNIQFANLPFFTQGSEFKTLQIHDTKLKVEMADTQAKRNKGLGGRQSLASEEGMLFIFPAAGKSPFWMKGLSFALDFIWIRGNKVVDVLANVQPPAPGVPDAALPIYQPKEEADKVLEVNAGTIDRLNIKVGDSVRIE